MYSSHDSRPAYYNFWSKVTVHKHQISFHKQSEQNLMSLTQKTMQSPEGLENTPCTFWTKKDCLPLAIA